MKYIPIITALSFCFFFGCITSWSRSNGKLLNKQYRYKMDISTPKGWYGRQIHKTMMYTKHGLSLEYILIERKKWSDTLSNGFSIPKITLLHELPEIILGELCAYSSAFNMDIISSEIVKIDDIPCSVTKYDYTSPNSLRMSGIMYCIPFKKNITVLRYTAEKSHYYEKSYNDFIDMIATMKIRDKKYLPLPGVYGLDR